MKKVNPFGHDWEASNDMEGFIMPYKLYGKTDLEVMTRRYEGLSNKSYGYIVRLNNSWAK
jgi:hypothetical protein